MSTRGKISRTGPFNQMEADYLDPGLFDLHTDMLFKLNICLSFLPSFLTTRPAYTKSSYSTYMSLLC